MMGCHCPFTYSPPSCPVLLSNRISVYFQALDQAKRYDGLSNQCKAVSGPADLGNFMRVLPLPPITNRVPRKAFAPPGASAAGGGGAEAGDEAPDFNVIIIMRPALSASTAAGPAAATGVHNLLTSIVVYPRYRMSSLSTGVHRFKCDPH